MMDEELHRVLIFLMEMMTKFPGWTHQAMLKQELFNAPMEGTLHRMLGSSSIETFTEFLKCFPSIFCINSNQLVQLSMKNGNVSDVSGLPLIDPSGGGPVMKLQDDCRGLPTMGVLPVGAARKPPDPTHLEWSAPPMSIVPESPKLGFLGHEQPSQPHGALCGIPASYPGTSGLGHRSGWDAVPPPPLPELHQSFLGSEVSRVRSVSHLANGWDRPPLRPAASPSCQPRFPEGSASGDTRLPLNHRYTWDTTPHSITDSLKNFSISDSSYPAVGGSEPIRSRWPPYTSLCNDTLESYPNHGSGDSRFMRPMTSVWDEPLRPVTPTTQPQVPPHQGFLSRGAGDGGGGGNLISHPSFKWEDAMPTPVSENSSALGFSSFNLPAASAKPQQPPFYEWKSPSPVNMDGGASFSSHESAQAREDTSPEPLLEVVDIPAVPLISPPINCVSPEIPVIPPVAPSLPIEEGVSAALSLPQALEPSPKTVASSPAAEPAAVAAATAATAPKQGATLSYAEALRSNTQRRKMGSESSNGSVNCVQASHATSSSPSLPTSLKLSITSFGGNERPPKSRRSLDGRCGKVEVLNLGDGVLRLGNGKVHFEKAIFYDSGKQVSDLRNILKVNDTVYFDAIVDGSGNHDWKATLAWVGKKPRSASSPTNPAPSGRGYRSVENHSSSSTSNNGVSSRAVAGSNGSSSSNKVAKESTSVNDATVEGTGEVVILFAHFGFIRRGKKFKENVHFNRNVFYASGNRVKELTDVLKEGSMVNYAAVPSDKKSCKWKAVLVWTGTRPKI